jgi:gamma-glutamylcyclotransferase (GGCT)/AIG2-like uncharacterized protein YtfP
MGDRLRRDASLVGEATMPGRLHSLGRYPGLVETPGAESVVHGEVYALTTPAVTLMWLDAYEGIVAHRPDESPYARVARPVRLASGETLTAWVYVYLGSVRTRPEIPGGRWTTPQV